MVMWTLLQRGVAEVLAAAAHAATDHLSQLIGWPGWGGARASPTRPLALPIAALGTMRASAAPEAFSESLHGGERRLGWGRRKRRHSEKPPHSSSAF